MRRFHGVDARACNGGCMYIAIATFGGDAQDV